MLKRNILLLLFFNFLCSSVISAQENYQVRVSLDKENWTYELNEKPKFTISVMLNDSPAAGLPLKYSCGEETLPPTIEKTVTTTDKAFTVEAGTLDKPGFLRCVATFEKDGKTFRGLGTAGFRPDLLKPTTNDPDGFDKFWNDNKAELAQLPIDAKFEPLPNLSTAKVDVFQVSFQNVGTGISKVSRIYGILAIPKSDDKNQKFPAVLHVPGAGIRPYKGQIALAERGIITLQIGIHGIPVNLDQRVYDDLAAGAMNRYMLYNLDNKDTYYYRRVFLGAIRANDFLTSLPQYDGKNLAVMGGSQGGALSIATAALDPRVKTLAAWIPALADTTGYIFGRAGGWPHAFKDQKNRTPEKIETSKFYDTVNFARRLKVPGFFAMGYNDEVCPPTSMFSAYNTITAPKKIEVVPEIGHGLTPKQNESVNNWIEKFLKEGKAQ